jgi:adenosyl cobinamide kinase/adenosyl cobinamide phosphate guanylyltransferase
MLFAAGILPTQFRTGHSRSGKTAKRSSAGRRMSICRCNAMIMADPFHFDKRLTDRIRKHKKNDRQTAALSL